MRLRITVCSAQNGTVTPTPAWLDGRSAADMRRDLWAHAPVEIDRDNPLQGIHRDSERRAYFELSTSNPAEVRRILEQYGYANRFAIRETTDPLGLACQNCGNIAGPVIPTICPNCEFRDISPCPICREEISRQSYTRIASDLFRCPRCRGAVRLHYNSPMFDLDGNFTPPLVVTEEASIA